MSVAYLLQGKLTAKPGQRDVLAGLLLEASGLVAAAPGCRLYVVGIDEQDPDGVYVTEIWDSREDHDNSLKIQAVRDLIGKAVPVLDGPPVKGQELALLGGTGI